MAGMRVQADSTSVNEPYRRGIEQVSRCNERWVHCALVRPRLTTSYPHGRQRRKDNIIDIYTLHPGGKVFLNQHCDVDVAHSDMRWMIWCYPGCLLPYADCRLLQSRQKLPDRVPDLGNWGCFYLLVYSRPELPNDENATIIQLQRAPIFGHWHDGGFGRTSQPLRSDISSCLQKTSRKAPGSRSS